MADIIKQEKENQFEEGKVEEWKVEEGNKLNLKYILSI
jgi:hypothetical protein